MRTATTPVGTGGNPNVGPPVRLPYCFHPLPIPVFVECPPPPPQVPPRKVLSQSTPMTKNMVPGLPPVLPPHSEGKINHSSRTRSNRLSALSSHLDPYPTLPLFNLNPIFPLISRLSRFSHPNPFSSLTSASESDDEDHIADPGSASEETIASLPPHPRDASDRPVTFPQPFTLLCPTVSGDYVLTFRNIT
jgi:hypothetical protein